IMLHVGTLLAVLIYFLPDWLQIVGQAFGARPGHDLQLKQNGGLLWLLALGSLPVGIAGLLFNKQAETTWRNPFVIGAMLIAVAIIMWAAEGSGRKVRDMGS